MRKLNIDCFGNIQSQRTICGQTAGGLLKTARIIEMQSGEYQVFVTLKNGETLRAILSDKGYMVLTDYGYCAAVLYTSAKAEARLAKLEAQADNLILKAVAN